MDTTKETENENRGKQKEKTNFVVKSRLESS